MKEKGFAGGLYYFDLVAALIGVAIVLGHRLITGGIDAAALIRDAPGWWIPLLAAALLFALRRRAYTQETPWVVTTVAALAFVGLAAVSWRWGIMAFIAAILPGSVLLLAGLILRRRRLSERLWRQDLFGLVAMVMGVLLTLAMIEGALRAFPGAFSDEVQQMLQANPENYGIADPYIGHLHKPNNAFVVANRDFKELYHTDGLGFRNTWPWGDRAEIVAIGDSLTFGYGVADNQTWPYLVGHQVPPLRVINLGLIGAGPQQYLRVFERFGIKLRPKLLLVGVFLGNDFWDANMFDRWLRSGAGGNYTVWRDFGRPRRVTFRLRDPLYSLEGVLRATVVPAVRRTYVYTLLRAIRGGSEGPAPKPPRTISFPDGRLQLLESDFLAMSAAAQPDRREFQLLLESLEQIDSLATRHGAHALMVLQPGKEQVYLPLLGETRGDPTSALVPALDRLGIDYLDLAPAFRARAAGGERLFFEVDGHPNQAGYALIAQLVITHIMENPQRYGLEE